MNDTLERAKAAWRGQWPHDELFEFLALAGRVSGMSQRTDWPYGHTLADLAWAGMTPERHAQELQKVHAHPCYKRLNKLPNFMEMEDARRAQAAAVWTSPVGEARLLYHVAMLVGGFDPTFRPRRATLEQQRQTLAAARKLSARLMPGAQPDDWRASSRLRSVLTQFEGELQQQIEAHEHAGTRPARAEDSATQRYWLIPLCRMLIESFDSAPPRIVAAIAGMLGYYPDDSTIARYIAAATPNA